MTTAGAYTYTPTQAARFTAGTTTTPISDTFTVTAADTVRRYPETVTVPVSPIQASVSATISIPGDPLGVTVSPNGKYAYVATEPTDTDNTGSVAVIDTATNTDVNNPATTPINVVNSPSVPILIYGDPKAVAVSPDGTYLYVTNVGLSGQTTGAPNTVLVYNTATNNLTAIVRNTGGAQAMVVSPDGSLVYLSTGKVIDTANNLAYGGSLPVGRGADAVAISPDGTHLYVASITDGTVTVIDTSDLGRDQRHRCRG